MSPEYQHTTLTDGQVAPYCEVACPYCGRRAGLPCITRGGFERRPSETHSARWDARRDAYRLPRRYVLKADDPRFGLTAGDVLVCRPYWLDTEKVTVLRREGDGFDPQCNQFRVDLSPIRGDAGVVSR